MTRWTRTAGTACRVLLLCLSALGAVHAQLAPPPLKPAPALERKPPALTPVAKPLPVAAVNAVPPTSPPRWCEDDCLVVPTRPVRFEILAGERSSSGFAVTQPGTVRVEVQAAGVPLVVSLRRPDGRVIERQGSGSIVIDDAASAADVARGVLWGVGLRAAQEPARVAPSALTAAVVQRAVASGTVSVGHPPADAALAQAALKRAGAQAAKQGPAAPAAPAVDAQVQTRLAQAQHDKQVAARHAAALARLQPALPAPAHAQINQRIALRLQGQSVQQAAAAVPVRLIKAEATIKPVTLALDGAQRQVAKPGLLGSKPTKSGSGSTQAAATGGAAVVGSGGGAATAAPTPVLVSLSSAEGDPGTPLTLGGSDFGDAPGEVHFIVGNGRDVAATITYWSTAQIVTEVPYADGIPIYDGHVYVKRGDGGKTALRPFRFLPLYDVAEIGLPASVSDWVLAPSAMNMTAGRVSHRPAVFWGFSGYDKFYLNAQLRNGWVVTGARLHDFSLDQDGHGGAYVAETRAGTTSPYVQVRWWLDADITTGSMYTNFLHYSLRVGVKRPKSLPCEANCPVL